MTIPRSPPLPLLHVALVFIFASSHLKGFAVGDASQGGESASTSPGCNVTSQDVKIKNWVNGDESASLDGLSARFGASLPTSVSKALRLPAILANPFNSCNKLSSKVNILIFLCSSYNMCSRHLLDLFFYLKLLCKKQLACYLQ
ncbi:signal peptide peptidase-like [Musa troglodytarum]|uniref:Signal peptide peptidase-like n=1 Tax=Musa troglodytarum TaxID=320322 RepID=A0A9E7JN63_9LILI|nr:signal peptide peptidase-like [Musa troglodytarum]